MFDLERWGTFYDVLQNDRGPQVGIQPDHVFLAIPPRVIDLSPRPGQNAGY